MIRKTETYFFEIRRDWVWVSAPQEGAGGMRGGFVFEFLAEKNRKIKTKMIKSFHE